MATPAIPFVNGKNDVKLVREYYPDAPVVHVSLELSAANQSALSKQNALWVDPAIDGLHDIIEGRKRNSSFVSRVAAMADDPLKIFTRSFLQKPDKDVLVKLVSSALDACAALSPKWITVPQLPHMDDTSRNKTNWHMAQAANDWFEETGFKGKRILPIVITNQNQLRTKADRRKRITAAQRSFERSEAHGYWVVDMSLDDSTGSKTLQNARFPNLVKFHDELLTALPNAAPTVAGPYWGLNLVLWARGLVDSPGIGLGAGYRYYLAGGFPHPPATRLVVPSIRQTAIASPQFRKWLDKGSRATGVDKRVKRELRELLAQFARLQLQAAARKRTAHVYREWLDRIESTPKSGRAVALFQDLSAAVVAGSALPELPRAEGTARHPGSVAQGYMLNCLPRT